MSVTNAVLKRFQFDTNGKSFTLNDVVVGIVGDVSGDWLPSNRVVVVANSSTLSHLNATKSVVMFTVSTTSDLVEPGNGKKFLEYRTSTGGASYAVGRVTMEALVNNRTIRVVADDATINIEAEGTAISTSTEQSSDQTLVYSIMVHEATRRVET